MREFGISACICTAWLAIGLLADDYAKVRDQGVYVKAVQQAHGALHQQQDGSKAGDGPEAKGGKIPKDPTHEEPKWTDVWLALFTFALAVGTIALFWDAKEKGRKELRAYLGIGGGEVFVLPNQILRGVVEIKNFGKTPARKVKIAVTGELRRRGDDRPFPQPDFIRHTHQLAPTMYWTVGHEFNGMTMQDLQDVLTDRKLVFIWGHAEYKDIYGKRQTLEFRFRNVVKVSVATEHGHVIQKWKYYPEYEGNEAD
jgi:hypothetical protein